jgi:hypothetical protein
MTLTIKPVETKQELRAFIQFPWKVNKGDPYWVPPLIADRYAKLDVEKNPFWQTAERQIWLALRDEKPVGTIAAINDIRREQKLKDGVGGFGFFDCIDDVEVARGLLNIAATWLSNRKFHVMCGPNNPSASDECGILVEGFNTRPAILEAHNPPYYASLMEQSGMRKNQDIVARLIHRPADAKQLKDAIPEKLIKVAELVKKRSDLKIRSVNLVQWDRDVRIACDIYNQALSTLPDYIPMSQEEFHVFANSFKSLVSPDLAKLAEVAGKPIGFALALPDVNQAFQHVNGRLDPLGLLKFLWFSRKLDRASFKILVMIPQFIGSGIETALVVDVAQALFDKKYKEVDMSLTGDENEKSNRYQDNLGMKIYRRYRFYEKDI